MSGAQKRKQAAEKKFREEASLVNVPKINELFSARPRAVPSSSSAIAITTENAEVDENTTNECEMDITSLPHRFDDGIDESVDECDLETNTVATASSHEYTIDSRLTQISTDPGLWRIPMDILSLQKYWIGKGKFRLRNLKLKK